MHVDIREVLERFGHVLVDRKPKKGAGWGSSRTFWICYGDL
jgi:hypothetical protein